MQIGNNGYLRLSLNSGPSQVGILSVASNATLDITNNKLTINTNGAGNSSFISTESQISTGYNSGKWTGAGITSTAAAINPSKFAVGYVNAG